MIRLREIRKERGITMKQLGSVVGLSESTISLYENGKHEADHKTLQKFADYFDVSVDYLLGRERDIDQTKSQPDAIIDDGLRNEIIRIFDGLSGSGREQALSYLRFLASDVERKADP